MHQDTDKIIQVFPCEYYDRNKDSFLRGKIYLMEHSYQYCPLLAYTSPVTLKFNSQIQKIKYSQIQQIDSDENTDTITITTNDNVQHIFRNFYAQRSQILEILHQCNDNTEPIPEVDHYDWDFYNDNAKRILPDLLKLKEGNQYNQPTTFIMEGLTISEMFLLLYDDQPYKPSRHFKLEIKQVEMEKDYQNVLHFFLEQVMGDKDIQSAPWSPLVPEYLRSGDLSKQPLQLYTLETLPTKRITYTHPTKLPFFGTINPEINMTQKLLLISDKEFIVQVTSETKGLPYCDGYRMMSHERVIELSPKRFQVICTFTIEWKKRIVFISNQVDNAGGIESVKVLNTFYIPYAKARLQEVLSLKSQQEDQQQRPQIQQFEQRKMIKSETTKIPQKFIINSSRNLDGQHRQQEIDQNFNRLEQRITQFSQIILSQEQQIKQLEQQQQTLIQITRICVGLCALFLFINWFIK